MVKTVYFSQEELNKYLETGTSMPFSKFVKSAFYEKIDCFKYGKEAQNGKINKNTE